MAIGSPSPDTVQYNICGNYVGSKFQNVARYLEEGQDIDWLNGWCIAAQKMLDNTLAPT